MGWAWATRQTHPWVYAFGEMTSNLAGDKLGCSTSSSKCFGSYQAPRYHIKTMLRARYFVSGLACTLSIMACARSDAFRLSLANCNKRLKVGWLRLFTQSKYSCLTLTGSEPGSDCSRSILVGDGSRRKLGASFSSAMPVSAADSNTKATMSWRVCALAGLSTAPTDIAAVAAAAPARTLRRVNPPADSSSCSSCAIAFGPGCGNWLIVGFLGSNQPFH